MEQVLEQLETLIEKYSQYNQPLTYQAFSSFLYFCMEECFLLQQESIITQHFIQFLAQFLKDSSDFISQSKKPLSLLLFVYDTYQKTYIQWEQKFLWQLIQYLERPLLKYLQIWIQFGLLYDPHKEFILQSQQKKVTNDTWFELNYSFDPSITPEWLKQAMDQVLMCSKLWQILRNAEEQQQEAQEEAKLYYMTEKAFFKQRPFGENQQKIFFNFLYQHYETVNKRVLLHLFKNGALNFWREMNHYFLFTQSDFFLFFMDLCWEDLFRTKSEISFQRRDKIQYQLEEALLQGSKTAKVSVEESEKFTGQLRFHMSTTCLLETLLRIMNVSPDNSQPILKDSPQSKDVHALVGLQIYPNFPMSLVFNSKACSKYIILFRHFAQSSFLMKSLQEVQMAWKRLERRLTWVHRALQQHSQAKTLFDSLIYQPTNQLLQKLLPFLFRMLLTLKPVYSQMHWQILGCQKQLEQKWLEMGKKLKTEQSIVLEYSLTQMIQQLGDEFLDACLSKCWINQPRVWQIFQGFMDIMDVFHKRANDFIQTFNDQLEAMTSGITSSKQNQFLSQSVYEWLENQDNVEQLTKTLIYQESTLLSRQEKWKQQTEKWQKVKVVVANDYDF